MKTLLLIWLPLIAIGCMNRNNSVTFEPLPPKRVISCASGYVLLPATPGFTSKPICIGKYEAHVETGRAVSSSVKPPTALRKKSEAISACKAAGPNYNLISNLQWQALARNIERTASNWSGEVIGSGALSLGHSDGDPAEALAASTNDSDGCYNIGDTDCDPSQWHFQKRTFKLSSGQIIWDVAGNLNEWVLESSTFDFEEMEGTDTPIEEVTSPQLKIEFGHALNTTSGLEPSLNGGLGYLKVDPLFGEYLVGTVRGGGFNSYVESGVFNARVNVPSEIDDYDFDVTPIGFRCVYQP